MLSWFSMLHKSGTNLQRAAGLLNLSVLLNPVLLFFIAFSPFHHLFCEATQMLVSYAAVASSLLNINFILHQFIFTCVYIDTQICLLHPIYGKI